MIVALQSQCLFPSNRIPDVGVCVAAEQICAAAHIGFVAPQDPTPRLMVHEGPPNRHASVPKAMESPSHGSLFLVRGGSWR